MVYPRLVIMIRKSRVFFTWLRSRTYGSETGQLSRLNQRCSSVLSKATRRCTRIQTRAEDETTMRGGAINNARQWLEQREERRIMAIPPMQPLPLARLALIPFLSSPLLSFSPATDFYSVTLAGGKFRGLRMLEIASGRDGPRMHGFYCHFYALHGGILTPPLLPFFGSLDRKPRDNVVFHRRRHVRSNAALVLVFCRCWGKLAGEI